MKKYIKTVLIFFSVLSMFFIPQLNAQDNIGLPFLKIGIGARQASMGSAFTGVGDDIYTMFWNPGGLGHIRRWQWAASYNRWFSDLYQAGFAYAGQINCLGSKKTTIGFSATYLGMPSWDATGGKDSPVEASHTTVMVSAAQRLDWLTKWVSAGANLRYISSKFDQYGSTGFSADAGVLIKTPRFKIGSGIFKYGVLRAGVSVQHIGSAMTFNTQGADLPRTIRSGMSFLMGSYRKISLLFAGEFVKVQGRDNVYSAGAEFWWKNIAAVRAGYLINGKDLGSMTFGFGLRWDDVFRSILGLKSKYGDAISIDIANAGFGDVLNQTYRGSVSHYPVAPEPFGMEQPVVESSINVKQASPVYLTWDKAFDPDIFDDVNYYIFIDKDKAKIERAVSSISRNMNGFLASSLKDSLFICEPVSYESFRCNIHEGGVYYWCVAAYDRAYHVRLARRGIHRVIQFVVATHDLAIDNLAFTPSEWIDTTPLQGKISFRVLNSGSAASSMYRIFVTDKSIGTGALQDTIFVKDLPCLASERDTVITFTWNTYVPGKHRITASIDLSSDELELEKDNNSTERVFVSIPKGTLTAGDTVEVMATGYETTEIPVVPEVYFEPFSDKVDSCYFSPDTTTVPVLTILSDRLKKHSEITAVLAGHIDALTGEKDRSLADKRAEAVRSQLILMGVNPSQIRISKNHRDKVLGRRRMPADKQDAIWIMEQYRKVSFSVPQKDEYALFGPITVAVDTTIRQSIPFDIRVLSPGGLSTWRINGAKSLLTLHSKRCVKNDSISGIIQWDGSSHSGSLVPRDKWIEYSLILTDSLDRVFRTHVDSIYLKEKQTIRRREIFGAAKFAKTEPVYKFYWDRLMEIGKELVENSSMRVRFEGHACAVGPENVNQKLSLNRALRFTEAFKVRLKKYYPGSYSSVVSRIDKPVGFGESEPLKVKLKNKGLVVLGNNYSPTGRYLNRRIMVLLYIEH